ncbi:MAG TPA: ribonuclease E/G, partial [Roseateles sp.]|nr:ribonuclease E/G [Roseateles sp.]
RERREDQAPDGAAEGSAPEVVATPAEEAAAEPALAAPAPVAVAAPVPAPVATAPATAPAPAAVSVPAFVLPLNDLQAVAEGAGLHWVNSDADKIRVAQEAMAAEPKPVHVPRERPPVVTVDEGPLVLVETRKDLAQIKLPFES